MTLYFILMLVFSGCGVVLLVGLVTRETVLNQKSERVFNSLVRKSELQSGDKVIQNAITAARKRMASVQAQVGVTAQGYESRGGSTPFAEEKAAREKLDEYEKVIQLLVETYAKSAGEKEFPIRAYARQRWSERARLNEVMLLLLADKEISKARQL
jgi:hypothetical protein